MVVGLLIGLQWLQENIQKPIMNENLEVIHGFPVLQIMEEIMKMIQLVRISEQIVAIPASQIMGNDC